MKFFRWILLLAAPLALPVTAAESVWDQGVPVLDKPVEMTVYRSPTCGCCGKWLEHMKKHGFVVRDVKSEEMDKIKQDLGVPKNLQSCHTAVVNGYVVEGHVPAGDVLELLRTHPEGKGLSAPGMPMGSPGMEMGGRKDPFAVLLFDKNGNARTFHEH
jgi:hypothetical protein